MSPLGPPLYPADPFPDILCYIGGILGAGGFAVFFGGNLYDALVAAVAGIVVTFFNLHKKLLNSLSKRSNKEIIKKLKIFLL